MFMVGLWQQFQTEWLVMTLFIVFEKEPFYEGYVSQIRTIPNF